MVRQQLQQIGDARQRIDALDADDIAVQLLLAEGPGFDLAGVPRPPEDLGNDHLVLHAEATDEVISRHGLAGFLRELLPALFVLGGRIDDDAVPVE